MPLLMLLAGVAAVVVLAREWQRQARVAVGSVATDELEDDVALSPDERKALTALLRREVAADEGLPLSAKEDM